jgi:tetratricopeptide (TPR) repeat protein
LDSLEEAHRLFVRLDDLSREGQTLGNMASVYAATKRREEANKAWSEAASIFQEVGDRQKQADTMMALGISLFKSGQRQEGLATYRAGMTMAENPTFVQKVYQILLTIQVRLFSFF